MQSEINVLMIHRAIPPRCECLLLCRPIVAMQSFCKIALFSYLMMFVNGEYGRFLGYLNLKNTETNDETNEISYRMLGPDSGCGLRNSQFYLLNGTMSPAGYWPWLVALGYRDNTEEPNFQCGGVLIAPTIILTAASCVCDRPPLYLVRMGTNELSKEDGQDYLISEAIVHAGFNAETNENNIALLKIQSPAKTDDFVEELCLPPKDSPMPLGTRLWIAGWDFTSNSGESSKEARQLQVSLTDMAACKEVFERLDEVTLTDERIFCAACDDERSHLCQDEFELGGPVMRQIDGVFYAVGIISFRSCSEPGYPEIYTALPAFMPWLERHIQTLTTLL